MPYFSTTTFVPLDRQIIGVVFLEDKLRRDQRSDSQEQGNEYSYCDEGDNERTANKIANEVRIEEYHTDLLPEDKVSIIE